MMNLDFSFVDMALLQGFVWKGLRFSMMLTLVATLGGLALGTLLALMRLSGQKWLQWPAAIYISGMRSIIFFILMKTFG